MNYIVDNDLNVFLTRSVKERCEREVWRRSVKEKCEREETFVICNISTSMSFHFSNITTLKQ